MPSSHQIKYKIVWFVSSFGLIHLKNGTKNGRYPYLGDVFGTFVPMTEPRHIRHPICLSILDQ
jgi:hypothetical protein